MRRLTYSGVDRNGTAHTGVEMASPQELAERLYSKRWRHADIYDDALRHVGAVTRTGTKRIWWAES
jgi:hypothetical protein